MPSRKAQIQKQLVAYSFIAPNFLGFAIFTLVPILFAFALAFLNWDGSNPITWAGLSNFKDLLDDDQFKAALRNTIVYAAGTVPLTLVCSLFLAVILNQGVRGKGFFRTVSFFPYIASLVAVAAVWNMIFNPEKGPVNMGLFKLGFEKVPGWAADKNWAMVTIILFSVWKYMGYYMIIYLAGLQGINAELYEAANLDGTNAWQRFRYVTVPQLRPTTFFVLVMLTIQCFKVYDIVYMLTQAGPGTATLVLVYDIYNKAFISWNLGSASAVAMVLFILVLAVTLLQFQGEKKMQ
ncbi:sugar ABC transporter permease [Sphaerochaeta sp. PS]|uniref:carbohydrate ABC transporter permease n=1 Tax=Sphaerochaeta sp. PS TaxID=3076336 RepID=UPI0028A4D45C|nr:sugar ABC transporter permease [Sphaerochaeta sp. PS]MDT4761689.1 sugar ABC transporter permease [Sphaerochaeta sp. PS]